MAKLRSTDLNGNLFVSGQLKLQNPFLISKKDLIQNLNADLLDGKHADDLAIAAHLGYYDTIEANADGTYTITRQTGYLNSNDLLKASTINCNPSNNYICQFGGLLNVSSSDFTLIICNLLPRSWDSSVLNRFYVYNNSIYLKIDGLTTTDAYKQYVAQNNLFFQYKLAKATTERVEKNHFARYNQRFILEHNKSEAERSMNLLSDNVFADQIKLKNISYTTNGSIITINATDADDPYLYFKNCFTLDKETTITLSLDNYNNIQWYGIVTNGTSTFIAQAAAPITLTLSAGTYGIGFEINDVGTNTYKVMLNEGSEPLPYQPYEGKVVHEKDLEKGISGKANLSGGNTFSGNQIFTGYLDIRGTAAEKHLKTRGIGGSDGNGNEAELYLQYNSSYATKFGRSGDGSLNSDGTITEAGKLLSDKYAAKSHTHTKSEVGLGNVDNTADANKSVKYATSAGVATNLVSFTHNYHRPVADGGDGKQWMRIANIVDNDIDNGSRWYGKAVDIEFYNNGYGNTGNYVYMGHVSICITVHNHGTFVNESVTIKWRDCKPNIWSPDHIKAVKNTNNVEIFMLNDIWDTAIVGVIVRNQGIDVAASNTLYTQTEFSNYISDKATATGVLDSNVIVGKADAANSVAWGNVSDKPFSGTSFVSGNSGNGEHNANNAIANGHYYYSSNGPATSLGASYTDGALYVQSHSDAWVGQIAQDYRNGSLFVRGKNNGSWSSWKSIIDSGNIGSQTVNYAKFIKPHQYTTSTGVSEWTPSGTGKVIWGQKFVNSSISTDTGDLVLTLRPSVYNSGKTELCMHIDGDYYSNGNKVIHTGNIGSQSIPEANLTWGGKNFSGSYGPIDAAMVPSLGANRLAFVPAAGVTVEYSRDAGSTWTDYGLNDTQKTALFSGPQTSTGAVIGKPSRNSSTNKYENVSVNNRLRVTLKSDTAHVYTALNKFVIYCSTSGSTGCKCTIQALTKNNYDAGNNSWTTFADGVDISGWSGFNVINTSSIITYGNNGSQYIQLRFTFYCGGNSSMETYGGLSIINIYGFGGVGWTTPSNMAKWGQLYSYDAGQNVFFPASTYSTTFYENGTSLANKYAAKSHTHTKSQITDFPTIPTVNNPTITINQGGTKKGSFTLNQSGATTIDLTDNNTTYTAGTGLSLSETTFSVSSANVSTMMNLLSEGTSDPTDNDYYISQYVGGGTTTTTYHRRPVSKLYNYMKGKFDSIYQAKGSYAASGHTHTSLNTAFVFNNSDMPEGSDNLSKTTTAHKINFYRNGLSIPYQMDNPNDGGILRCRGNSESNVIFELGTWDDSGAGETIQFNYYPTTSQVTPTYSVSVPKKTGTIALTNDIPTSLPANGGTSTYATYIGASGDAYSKSDIYNLINSRVPKKHSSAFYPYIGSTNRQSNYKITLPISGYTSSNYAWMMITMELVLGGSYEGGANGKIFLCYYFLKSQSNVWSADHVRAIGIGNKLSDNEVSIQYDITNPGIFYVHTNNSTYNSFSIQNLTANDSALSFDFSNTSIEAVASIPSGLTKVPLTCVDSKGDNKLYVNNTAVSLDGHAHSYILDAANNATTTFAYSKSGLGYGDYTWLAGWNGYELRAVNKSQFATAGHTHTASDVGAAASGHDHDGRYVRWNGSSAGINDMTWGTLTAANGYTILSHNYSSDGGEWGMVNKSGQISMQLDGYYYQNEGQYRVLDTSGGTLSGALNFNNSTWNLVGDDVYIGDYDQAGSLGVKGKNGQTNIGFVNQSNNYYIKLASPGVTANRTITMPDDTGTIALTKNIPTIPDKLPASNISMSFSNGVLTITYK